MSVSPAQKRRNPAVVPEKRLSTASLLRLAASWVMGNTVLEPSAKMASLANTGDASSPAISPHKDTR